MREIKLKELLKDYQFGNKEGIGYKIFEDYKEWFKETQKNGVLKSELLEILVEAEKQKDLVKYDFALLVFQGVGVDLTEEDKHFSMLFSIAESITKDYKISHIEDKEPWLLHQLADICIHYGNDVSWLVSKKHDLVANVITQIGCIKYEKLKYGPQMYFATYKAVGLIWDLDKETARALLDNIYLKHFDSRVVEDAQELEMNLKEENRL